MSLKTYSQNLLNLVSPKMTSLTVTTAMLLTGCANSQTPTVNKDSGMSQLTKNLVNEAQPLDENAASLSKISSGALVIDVRSADEFSSGHHPQAINIPHDQIAFQLAKFADNPQQDIVVYCRSGKRAEMAKQTLLNAGFSSVYNAGGYEELVKQLP